MEWELICALLCALLSCEVIFAGCQLFCCLQFMISLQILNQSTYFCLCLLIYCSIMIKCILCLILVNDLVENLAYGTIWSKLAMVGQWGWWVRRVVW